MFRWRFWSESTEQEAETNEKQANNVPDEVHRSPESHGCIVAQQYESQTHVVELARAKHPRAHIVVLVVAFVEEAFLEAALHQVLG